MFVRAYCTILHTYSFGLAALEVTTPFFRDSSSGCGVTQSSYTNCRCELVYDKDSLIDCKYQTIRVGGDKLSCLEGTSIIALEI